MKNLSLKIFLVIGALFGSVGVGFAEEPIKTTPFNPDAWKVGDSCLETPVNCTNVELCILVGRRAEVGGSAELELFYPGHFVIKSARNLECKIKRVRPSILKQTFYKLSKKQRKLVQRNLLDLDYYKSSIDGLYGKGTAGALTAYNKQNLDGADLRKSANVETLIKTVLALKIKLEEAPVPTPKIEAITETESQPATSTEAEPKEKRDLDKEFGLSLYGSFLHSEKIPNALFFFDDIEQNDSFEFRKALRNHDVDLIVLSSPGGSVFEGLQIAGIIHDKGLHTYIPKNGLEENGDCASACSFMFFAGATRSAEGNLVYISLCTETNPKRKKEKS